MGYDKISVIIPAYNVEKEILNCLESVENQTYRNMEIIVIDDGSTDRTLEVLRGYEQQHPNITIVHQENQGVFSARLQGIQIASGEWIGFVDGDDEIEEDMYHMLIKNAREYHADISHCGYQMIFPDRTDFYYGTGKTVHQDHKTGLKDLLTGSFVEPTLANKLYRRNLFDGLEERIDTSIKINEDLLMNYYLFEKAKQAVFYDKCYYHYRIRKNSATKGKLNIHKLEDPQKVLSILRKETEGETELRTIVEERYARQLIRTATMSLAADPELIQPYRFGARQELWREQKKYLTMPGFRKKLKLMLVCSACFPDLYRMVHAAYEHITGIDKKYTIR